MLRTLKSPLTPTESKPMAGVTPGDSVVPEAKHNVERDRLGVVVRTEDGGNGTTIGYIGPAPKTP